MERLVDLGLAELREDDWHELEHGAETQYHVTRPLTYGEFYNDGSVDSEFTFTLMLDNPENVFLIPKIIKIFKELADRNGQGMDVRGAGMHTAFINDGSGYYPTNPSQAQEERFYNYRKSMRMLLPALYFLGANSDISRGLGFRRPDIGYRTHRTAVDFRGGALEFRIFDTCYDKPDTILDNIVVMSRSLKYWKRQYKSSGVEKIATRVKFGKDNNDNLDRFYVTYTHLDLLNFGLNKLKPSYYTTRQLKAQRKFVTDKRSLTKLKKENERAATAEFKEYENRFEFGLIANRGRYISRLAKDMEFETTLSGKSIKPKDAQAHIEAQADEMIKTDRKRKKSIKRYVSDKLKQLESNCGDFTLAVD